MKNRLNDQRSNVLVKLISDSVGFSTGEEYFNALICAISTHLDLSCGFIFSVDESNDGSCALIADSIASNTCHDLQTSLDPSIIELILNDKSIVIIDLESDFDATMLDNPSGYKSIVSFPLYDSDNTYTGILVFPSTEIILEQNLIVEVIESQIPRAASELERLKIKRKLNLFERNYNNLIESTQDAIWEADIYGHITDINGACREIYGHPDIRMIGKCYTDFMTDSSALKFVNNLELVMQGKPLYNILSDHLTKDYEHIKVKYNIIPRYDKNNNISGIIGATRDITASVKARNTIKNTSELFSSILSRLPVIFFRVDEKGNLVDIRGNGLKRIGVEDLDWVGRPGYGLFIGMDEKIDSALSGNTVFFENKGTYKGTPWWFYTSMFFDSWSGYGAVGFSVDITEQKYVEEQLVELLNNNRKLAQKLVEVQEDERRTLARELHDELGQSITAVKSLATVITASAGDQYSEIRSLANSIIDLSGRLYEVVNNIMQRLRPDIIDDLDFSETIKNCIVRSELETTGVNCELIITGSINDLEEVVKVTIYRIVQECLTNISKHAMASNVTIHIKRETESGNHNDKTLRNDPSTASVKRDIIKIDIKDDGIGMNVKQKMQTGKHAKRHGLQGINERVTAMGGMLEITGKPGKGAHVQAVLVLGGSNHDVSHDINKCITDLRKMRISKSETKNIHTH